MARFQIIAALLPFGMAVTACSSMDPDIASRRNPTLYSVHQPVVQRSDYVLDLAAAGGVPETEEARLRAWFDSLQLRYGDRVSVDEPGGYVDARSRQDVAAVAASYGLLLSDGAPLTAGAVQPGMVRVVVSRTTASVPSCPDWSYANLPGSPNSTDSNYGCAVNSNLAAMIADPNDLVLGQSGSGSTDPATSTKAIRTYRDKAPTGAGPLKSEKAGGN